MARKLGIKTSSNYKRLLSSVDVDLIINVTAIEKMHVIELTKQLAITDELTSLYNHRHFVNRY